MKKVPGILLILVILTSCGSRADNPRVEKYLKTPWQDDFTVFDDQLWKKLHKFTWENNGSVMMRQNVEFTNGLVGISFDKTPGFFTSDMGDRNYSCGQLLNRPFLNSQGYDFSYGRYTVRMKAATGSGVVSSFFLFRWDPWQEIDVEFLGKDTTKLHINIFYNSVGNRPDQDPEVVDLGFDSAADFHEYTIEWAPGYIAWSVDGKEIRRRSSPGKAIPSQRMYLSMNVWYCTGAEWAGNLFTEGPHKRTAWYDRVEYVPAGWKATN